MTVKKYIKKHEKEIVLVCGGIVIGVIIGKHVLSYKTWLRGFIKYKPNTIFVMTDDKNPLKLFVGIPGKKGVCSSYTKEQAEMLVEIIKNAKPDMLVFD